MVMCGGGFDLREKRGGGRERGKEGSEKEKDKGQGKGAHENPRICCQLNHHVLI